MQEILSFFIVLIVYIIAFYVLITVISKNSSNIRDHFAVSTTAELKTINYHIFNWEPVVDNVNYFYNLNDDLINTNINTTINTIMEYKYKYYFNPNIIQEDLKQNLGYYFTNEQDHLNTDYLNQEISNIGNILFTYTDNKKYHPMIGDILLNIINSNYNKDELHVYFVPFLAKDNDIISLKYNGITLIFVGLYMNKRPSLITYPQWEQGLVKLDINMIIEAKLDCNSKPLPPIYSSNERFLDRVCQHLEFALEPSYILSDNETVIEVNNRFSGIPLELSYMETIEDDPYKLDMYTKINNTMVNNIYNFKEYQTEYKQYIDEQSNRTITLPSLDKLYIPKNHFKLSFI